MKKKQQNATVTSDGNLIVQTLQDDLLSYREGIILNKQKSISAKQLAEIINLEYGRHLAKQFLYEWELANLREACGVYENEHARSLALLFENESQKMQLQDLNRRLSEADDIHQKDLKMAESVQRSLLFRSAPETENYDIALHYEPHSSVSGDFYDFYIDEKKELNGVVMVDVSGHGIASSLITVLTKPIFFRTFQKHKDESMENIISTINAHLINQINESGNYLTAVLMRFYGNDVEYVNAGHPDVFLKSAGTDRCVEVKPDQHSIQGSVLGIESINEPFESYSFTVNKDDILLIYTDCLIESRNTAGNEFGHERVRTILHHCPSIISVEEILQMLLSEFKDHIKNTKLNDDLSIIVLKKK